MTFQQEPWWKILWVGSDLMIFLACLTIPLAIWMVLRRRPELKHRRFYSLFACFVLLCGIAHAIEIVALWYPAYPFSGIPKIAVGLIAMVTALVLLRLIPTLVRIPSPAKHEEVIAQLELSLADLSRVRDELEGRIKQRTGELKRANTQLAETTRETVQRSRNLIQLVSSLTRPGSEAKEYSEGILRDLRGRINALAIATSTVMEQGNMSHASLDRVVRRQVEPMFAQPDEQLRTTGPQLEVSIQGAQQISLIAWELASRFSQMSRAKQARRRISVNWSVAREMGQPDSLEFEWCEMFGPSDPDLLEPVAEGDGTYTPELLSDFSERLLTQIVPHLLGGKGRVEIAPGTFIYRLTCPLSAVENRTSSEWSAIDDSPPQREARELGEV